MPSVLTTVITDQIALRPARASDHPGENRALRQLARALGNLDANVLELLARLAMQLCRADTAGISLLEFDGPAKVFRWHAIVGQWAHFTGGSLPRFESPCGVVIDRNATQLMSRPGRDFPLLAAVDPGIVEVLLAPFHVLGEPVGTVWVLAHDETPKFDAEDVRLIESLASFAAAAYTVRDTLARTLEANEELRRANARLNHTVERLARGVAIPTAT